jgi:hypothetical protein
MIAYVSRVNVDLSIFLPFRIRTTILRVALFRFQNEAAPGVAMILDSPIEKKINPWTLQKLMKPTTTITPNSRRNTNQGHRFHQQTTDAV